MKLTNVKSWGHIHTFNWVYINKLIWTQIKYHICWLVDTNTSDYVYEQIIRQRYNSKSPPVKTIISEHFLFDGTYQSKKQ